MACSEINSEEILKLNERLYSESYFRLLRLKNNAPESANEIRDLIRQIDIHCSFQNLNKKSSDVLKSQLISEYSSIVDNQEQEGLLPIVTDDIKEEWFPSSSKNNNYTLIKGRQCCMDYILKCLGHKSTSTVEISKTPVSNLYSKKPSYGQSSLNLQFENFKSKQNDLSVKSRPAFRNQDDVPFTNTKINNSNSSISLNRNQIFHQKQSAQTHTENVLKRRSNDSIPNFSKRHNNRKNNDEQATKDTIKNSFIPASSMYKNPLKTASNAQEKQPESSDLNNSTDSDIKNHPTLKNVDAKIVGIILSEIMDFSPDIKWNDIAGLEFVKSTVQEIVIWPLLRPDIFTGLRAPPRGILLFGPPGTGKTLIGKCIATESNSTFFCISASSLASKWVGESEQLVRALFAIAQLHQPAVIFIDEIDSLLSQRSDQEQDHTRKLKTEFLVQFDGAKTTSERRVLVVGATNRPHELDEAARRRFVKRLYVPLPEESARLQIIEKLLVAHQHNLSSSDFKKICEETEGYSGSDVAHLCKEAAMGPIRSIGPEQIKTVSLDQVRPIELIDFLDALKQVRASVAQEDLNYYLDWNKKFGSFAI